MSNLDPLLTTQELFDATDTYSRKRYLYVELAAAGISGVLASYDEFDRDAASEELLDASRQDAFVPDDASFGSAGTLYGTAAESLLLAAFPEDDVRSQFSLYAEEQPAPVTRSEIDIADEMEEFDNKAASSFGSIDGYVLNSVAPGSLILAKRVETGDGPDRTTLSARLTRDGRLRISKSRHADLLMGEDDIQPTPQDRELVARAVARLAELNGKLEYRLQASNN